MSRRGRYLSHPRAHNHWRVVTNNHWTVVSNAGPFRWRRDARGAQRAWGFYRVTCVDWSGCAGSALCIAGPHGGGPLIEVHRRRGAPLSDTNIDRPGGRTNGPPVAAPSGHTPRLERVSVDSRTGLWPHREFLPGKGSARPETALALLATTAYFADRNWPLLASPAPKPRGTKSQGHRRWHRRGVEANIERGHVDLQWVAPSRDRHPQLRCNRYYARRCLHHHHQPYEGREVSSDQYRRSIPRR